MYTGINGPKYNIGGGGPADDMYRFKEESSDIVADSCVLKKQTKKSKIKKKDGKKIPRAHYHHSWHLVLPRE